MIISDTEVIYNKKAEKVLSLLDDNLIDLVVTSPTYKDSDNYTEFLMKVVFREVFRVQKKNSLLFLPYTVSTHSNTLLEPYTLKEWLHQNI